MVSDEADKPSKSELKRQMLARQKLGQQLLEISPGELAQLALPEDLHEALQLAARIKSHEGKRRQMQYVGKLMRQIDTSAIETYLAERQAGHQKKVKRFHELELLRDKLIDGSASAEQILARYPQADRSQITQLLRSAHRDIAQEKPPKSARKLFRYLRELDELQEHEESLKRDDY